MSNRVSLCARIKAQTWKSHFVTAKTSTSGKPVFAFFRSTGKHSLRGMQITGAKGSQTQVAMSSPLTSATPSRQFWKGCDGVADVRDRKSTRLNSSHPSISYAVFCLKKKNPTSEHHP